VSVGGRREPADATTDEPGDRNNVTYIGIRARQELDGEFCSVEGAEWPPEYFSNDLWFREFPSSFVATALALDPSKGKDARVRKAGAAIDVLGPPDNVTGTVVDNPAPVDVITSSATGSR
jgi:hypothetical protein